MRGIHLSPFSIAKMRRIKKWHDDNDIGEIRFETERSTFTEVEIMKIKKEADGKVCVSFWGLDYRGYREWLIEIERIERIVIE